MEKYKKLLKLINANRYPIVKAAYHRVGFDFLRPTRWGAHLSRSQYSRRVPRLRHRRRGERNGGEQEAPRRGYALLQTITVI